MLKELIQKDFIESMKLKQERKKLALSSLKTKITEAEKLNGNIELSDDEIIKVVTKAVKQREESYKIYVDAGRTELAENEKVELDTLKVYLPKQMSIEEITTEVKRIIETLGTNLPKQALIGKTIGTFNKEHNGKANLEDVKSVVNQILE